MKVIAQYSRSALLLGLVWSASGCDRGLTSVNEDPNAPTDVPAQFLLPQAIRAGVMTSFGAGMMLSHTGVFAQHVSQIQYPDEETGLVRPGTMDIFWSNYYVGPLKDIQEVINKGDETGLPNHEGVGLIWRAWMFHQVADLWGDIPFRQALIGEENTAPAYESQRAVYQGVLADLAQGAAMLDPNGVDFGAGDLLYNNNFERWRRFANSVRMRVALRLVNQDAALAQSEFVAAYNAGGFQSNADNAALIYPGAPYENPLHANYLGRDDHSISATMVDTLASLNDPRLQLYAEPAQEDGAFRGNLHGRDPALLPLAYYSRIGDFWRADGATTPSLVITYAEVLFLQAEAAQRGWIGGDPAALYEQAIRANMTQWNAFGPANAPTAAEIDAYLAQPSVQYNPARGLEQIHLQLWIALYMNTNEAWAHQRRTGTPSLLAGPDMVISRIPVRFSYPDTEQSLNAANLNAAVANQGGGLDLVTPLWFHKQ
jgi:hypothetical protein